MLTWVGFMACAAVIVFCGIRLSRYGDVIADRSGMGRSWVGLVLMATVTSLPELFSGVSSVMIVDAPDLATGDVIGSCAFNLLILAGLDLMVRPEPLTTKAAAGHVLTAALGILLIAIVAGALAARTVLPAIGWFGLSTPAIAVVYAAAMRMVYDYEKRQMAKVIEMKAGAVEAVGMTLREALKWYALNAALVVVAALALPHLGAQIAVQTGLGQTFVGSVLIAMSTSLPELVVSVEAVRIGALDLAVGNLLGSNIFNIFILAIDDMLYTKGPILSAASPNHMVFAVAAIAMAAIAVIGITVRAQKKPTFMAWDSLAMVLVFITGMGFLYQMR